MKSFRLNGNDMDNNSNPQEEKEMARSGKCKTPLIFFLFQSEVSHKEKHQYSIVTHIYGI